MVVVNSASCAVQGVANRDLKLENLLLDRDGSDGTRPLLKICDFGYSKVRHDCKPCQHSLCRVAGFPLTSTSVSTRVPAPPWMSQKPIMQHPSHVHLHEVRVKSGHC